MTIRAHYFTDPACSASWAFEPVVRELMVGFGNNLAWTYVMGGLAREYEDTGWLIEEVAENAGEGRMPADPLLWSECPISSTYPACMGVKAAAEQGPEAAGRYLRTLREGLMCLRRKLDTTEALVEEARATGLDARRFRSDLASHAIVEAFGMDHGRTRDVPEEARAAGEVTEGSDGKERVPFPTICFEGEAGERRWIFGRVPYGEARVAAEAAGAALAEGGRPSVSEALERFPRMAAREVEAVCALPEAQAQAELWRLVGESRARPVHVLDGYLFERV